MHSYPIEHNKKIVYINVTILHGIVEKHSKTMQVIQKWPVSKGRNEC